MNKQKIIYIVLLVVLLIVFAVSAVYVVSYFLEGQKQQEQFDELANIVDSIRTETNDSTQPTTPGANSGTTEPTEVETTPDGETVPTEPTMLPEYAALYELNSDIVGWIKIDGTVINYPVMQTPDSIDFYLKRNFNKENSERGCIYVREQCDVNEPSDNLTIYGHNMNDGSMFHSLKSYQTKSYWESNNIIVFDTLYERHTYQIFAVFKTTASVNQGFTYHLFVDAEDEADFNDFIATCKELSFYDTGITPVYGDKIICLSTCEYTQHNGRLVVAAVRIS